MDVSPPPHAKDRERPEWVILSALIVAELVSSFEGSMIYAALASFYRLYGDPIAIGWLVTGYMLLAMAAAAICARLGDIYGRKKVLIICLALALCGSLVSAATDDLRWIIAGRTVQGFAGAILPLCYGMVREYFAPDRVAINIGWVSATASAGAGIGILFGGVLVDHGSWRAIFLCSAALAAVAVLAVWFLVPGSRQFNRSRIDWLGGILFVPGLTLLLYALGLGEEHGWGSVAQLSCLGISLALIAIWIIHELRTDDPMIDVRMLINRQIGLTAVSFVLLAIGTMNIAQIVLVMLQQPQATGIGLGLSATVTGMIHTPGAVIGFVAGPVCGWYAARKGSRNAMILACACAVAAWLGLAVAHSSVWLVAFWMFLNSFAVGAAMAAAPNLIVEAAPDGRTSEATGLGQIARKIGMAVGAQLVAILLATTTVQVDGGTYPAPEAYLLSFVFMTLTCGGALAACLFLPSRKRTAQDGSYPASQTREGRKIGSPS
ncbi:MAG: MFS transporter [Novosphingobium sp.]|nr:MFS transporter [Novosphingobium sp.]